MDDRLELYDALGQRLEKNRRARQELELALAKNKVQRLVIQKLRSSFGPIGSNGPEGRGPTEEALQSASPWIPGIRQTSRD